MAKRKCASFFCNIVLVAVKKTIQENIIKNTRRLSEIKEANCIQLSQVTYQSRTTGVIDPVRLFTTCTLPNGSIRKELFLEANEIFA